MKKKNDLAVGHQHLAVQPPAEGIEKAVHESMQTSAATELREFVAPASFIILPHNGHRLNINHIGSYRAAGSAILFYRDDREIGRLDLPHSKEGKPLTPGELEKLRAEMLARLDAFFVAKVFE